MARTLWQNGPSHSETEFEYRLEWFTTQAEEAGFTPADTSAVADAVKAVITSRADFITERGMAAVGPLMGMVMAELGGSADGALVSQILREKISEILKD